MISEFAQLPTCPGPPGQADLPASQGPEPFFEWAFEHNPSPMSISYPDGRYQAVNLAFLALAGYPRQALLGRTCVEVGLVLAQDRQLLHGQLLAQGKLRNERLDIHTSQGLTRTCLMSVELLGEGDHSRVLTSLQDITPIQAEVDGLERNQEILSKIFKASPDAISITSMATGTYQEVNQVFLELLGLEREQVVGHTSRELGVWVEPDDRR